MRKKLFSKLKQFISSGETDDALFCQLALELWQYQYRHVLPYRNYCAAICTKPPESWADIPAVPTDAFKQLDIPLTSLTKSSITKVFQTSGTTGEIRGQHYFSSTELYETSILAAWNSLPPMGQTFFLTPSPQEAPNSSLVHMMETLRLQHSPKASYLMKHGAVHLEPLKIAIQKGRPITLLGTALAFLHITEKHSLPLPNGSWCMETGGYKGTGKSLQKSDFYQILTDSLQLPDSAIWNEYSMTELSSQYYTNGYNSNHKAPPWTRIRVIHPESGQHVEPGEMGYLEIIDLANLDSVAAIRTQDIAIFQSPSEFTLIGRDPSAIPRGCSRSAAEALEKSQPID